MKVESPGMVHPPGESPQRRAGHGPDRPAASDDGGGRERSPHDEVVLFGVPEGDLSAAAREALMALGGEVGELRRALEVAQRRLALLEGRNPFDPLLPLLNRRSLLRELGRMAGYTARYGAPLSVLVLRCDGLARLREISGHEAADAVLRSAAELLGSDLREPDIAGRVTDDGFAILLPHADAAAAAAAARRLAGALDARFADRGGDLVIRSGLHAAQAGETADSILEAALSAAVGPV